MDTNLERTNFKELSWEQCHDIAGFSGLNRALMQLQERLERTQPLIEQIKAGLPDGIRIVAQIQFMSGSDQYPPTVIYRRQDDGSWQEHGRIVTVGGHEEFYGDGGFVTDEGAFVVTDSQAGVGVTVEGGSGVKFVDLAEDPNTGTIGGSSLKRHESTLWYLNEVPAGEEKHFDCMWP